MDYKFDYFDFLRDFEVKKRIIEFEKNDMVIFKVLIKLLEFYKEKNLGSDIKIVVNINLKYMNSI